MLESLDEIRRDAEWSLANSLRRRKQRKNMIIDIGPIAILIALGAVIGALAGSVLWGLCAVLTLVTVLNMASAARD